jgi:hypothetical protein
MIAAALFGTVVWFSATGCSGQRGDPSHADGAADAGSSLRTAMERNADCCMCHQPFLSEPLSKQHAAHSIACADCHGPSHAHSTDEHFQKPPDVVMKPKDVDPFCLRCHAQHEPKKPPRNSLAATSPNLLGTQAPSRCTSCHGRHRIARATTRP